MYVLFKIKLYKNVIYCLFIAFLKGLYICIYSRCFSIFILVHWCCCSGVGLKTGRRKTGRANFDIYLDITFFII